MSNPTQVHFKQNEEGRTRTTHGYTVGVFGNDGAMIGTARSITPTRTGDDFTATLPDNLFEVPGRSPEAVSIGVIANGDGGPSGLGLSAPFTVLWEPLPVTDVTVE